MSETSKPTFKGYAQQDWDEVADNPELTPADFEKARSGAEAFPELVARRRGRPKVEAPKVAVNIRVAPDVLAAYQAGGRAGRPACMRPCARVLQVLTVLRKRPRVSPPQAGATQGPQRPYPA
ncbi:BrnA antitoxin family protein [Microvirga vignae]|uniref:BrnA antitoxin family protein n=1 Tax=Microvirga vignae TaxID=1225564 RepID=UPI000A70F188|nr:BrnA antitoxin family protein [Microvirga vignae]